MADTPKNNNETQKTLMEEFQKITNAITELASEGYPDNTALINMKELAKEILSTYESVEEMRTNARVAEAESKVKVEEEKTEQARIARATNRPSFYDS